MEMRPWPLHKDGTSKVNMDDIDEYEPTIFTDEVHEDGAFDFDSLRALICGIRPVGEIDSHRVIRRESVIEILERFRPER